MNMSIDKEKKFRFRNSLRIKLLIILVAITLIVLMFPKGESLESEVTVGSIWIQDDLIASTSFPVLKKPDQFKLEKEQAAEKVYPFFVKNNEISKQKLSDLKDYNKKLVNYIDEDILFNINSQSVNKSILTEKSYNSLRNLRKLENILSNQYGKSLSDVFSFCNKTLKEIYDRGVLDKFYNEIPKDSVSVKFGKTGIVSSKRDYFDLTAARNFIKDYLENSFSKNIDLNQAVFEYLNYFLEPDVIYDEPITKIAIENAVNMVSPNIGIVNENERIIAKHDKVTPDAKLKIDSYRIAKGEESGYWNKLSQNIGKIMHIILISVIFMIYIFLFRKKIFNDNSRILIITIIILFVSFQSFLVQQMNVNSPVEFLILVPVASMLLTILFDSRIGFYGTVIVALICGALRSNDYVFALTNILAGAVAAYTVRDIKNRSQIIWSFMYIFSAYIASIFTFGFESFTPVETMLYQSAFALGNAVMSSVITYGLIIFFEKIFKITTDLTLLELTDFNRPLLKELAANAPGTFNHSMVIGSLVETAAEKINANPLLARVGAYYHDIGKMLDPVLFVENQMDSRNIHENLTPKESAGHIVDHVKKGIELAEKNDLPDEIVNFIPMHHGTMVISYFYEKAKESAEINETVDINDFRYPGPKPNSKETALVMLGDACESTVRSMQDPDPKKIENVINNLINYRIEDGQLDDSPITFQDIKLIKEAFLSILIGQHHKRIRYPKQDELEQEKKLQLKNTDNTVVNDKQNQGSAT